MQSSHLQIKPAFQSVSALLCTGTLLLTASCSSGGSSSSAVRYFPVDLAIASPTQSSASSTLARTSSPSARILASDPVYGEDYATLITTLVRMLDNPTSAADCAFTLNLAPTFEDATCYGPQLTYSGHPDGSPTSGTLPSGDVGLWESTETGSTEACAAAQLNKRMNGIAKLANGGVYLAASLYCSADVEGISLPTTSGGVANLTSEFNATVETEGNAVTITSAKVTCTDDDGFKCTEYVATLEGAAGSKSISLRMKHVPSNSLGTRYAGKLSYTVEDPSATEPNCQGTADASTGVTYAVSIGYEKTSSTDFTYKLDSGTFCGLGEDPYVSTSNYTVDPAKTLSGATGWSGNFTRATANFEPDSGEGDYSLTWQAGPQDSHARSMLIHIEQLAATNAGIAYFGYGPQIDESDAGSIDGMICNWAGPGSNHSLISSTPYAQKQIFGTGTDGVYTAVTNHIRYAPTNSCELSSGGSASFAQVGGGGTADIASGSGVTHELVDATEVTVTVPSDPEDVDL